MILPSPLAFHFQALKTAIQDANRFTAGNLTATVWQELAAIADLAELTAPLTAAMNALMEATHDLSRELGDETLPPRGTQVNRSPLAAALKTLEIELSVAKPNDEARSIGLAW